MTLKIIIIEGFRWPHRISKEFERFKIFIKFLILKLVDLLIVFTLYLKCKNAALTNIDNIFAFSGAITPLEWKSMNRIIQYQKFK
jgi:hypothetical protein